MPPSAGIDLDALRAAFTGIGLTPDFGGPHGNGVTQMALIGFDDGSYLELIAPVKKDDPKLASSSDWAKFIVGNAGPCAWAMGSSDIHGDVERLKKAGIETEGPGEGAGRNPTAQPLNGRRFKVGGTPAAGAALHDSGQDSTRVAGEAVGQRQG